MNYINDLRALVGPHVLITVAAGVLIHDNQNRLLLQRRSDNGLWGIPGGCMEIGEKLEDTARREVREETGLEVHSLQLFDVFSGPDGIYTYPNGDQVANVSVVYRELEVRGQLAVDGNESLELRYFTAKDLPLDECTTINRPILESYLRSLEQK